MTGVAGAINSSGIYVLNIATKEMHPLIVEKYGNVMAQSWTGDGKQLIFSAISSSDLNEGLWIIDTHGSTTPEPYLDGLGAALSSTGNVAIYRKDFNTATMSLYLRHEGTDTEKLFFSTQGVTVTRLDWSRDGSMLSFSVEKDTNVSDIYVFNARSMAVRRILADSDVQDPSWSPNGKMIAYASFDSARFPPFSLHLMTADGHCDVEVPSKRGFWSPAWSPDGSHIAFIGNGNGIYLLNLTAAFGRDIMQAGLPCP